MKSSTFPEQENTRLTSRSLLGRGTALLGLGWFFSEAGRHPTAPGKSLALSLLGSSVLRGNSSLPAREPFSQPGTGGSLLGKRDPSSSRQQGMCLGLEESASRAGAAVAGKCQAAVGCCCPGERVSGQRCCQMAGAGFCSRRVGRDCTFPKAASSTCCAACPHRASPLPGDSS